MNKECVNELKNILKEYENDEEVIKWINNFLKKDLRTKINEKSNERKKTMQLLIEKHNYINSFLDSEIKYYSLKNIREEVLYIKYDGISFKHCTNDEIIHNVIQDLTNEKNPILSSMKYEIADDILILISNRLLFEAMPESTTIQDVITFFCPMFFHTKEETKYFFTVIGDSILKKTEDKVYYIPECSREFLSLINIFYKDYKGSDANLNNFKFKYRGHPYDKSRLIRVKNSISSIVYINEYLKKNIFNIIVVSCHYSLRYQNAENYLMKQNQEIKNNVLYLSKSSKSSIIDNFLKEKTDMNKNDDQVISPTDLKFLWKLFCDKKHMPLPMYGKEWEPYIMSRVKKNENGLYKGISSSYLEPAKYFKKFWNFSIEITEKGEDYFELSEICELYNIWLKHKMNKDMIIKESKLKELIEYFFPDVEFDNKMILDRRCIFWNKKEDIKESIKNKFMKDINTNLTFLKTYLSYCSYCDKKKKVNIVSKKYFEKYIGSIIPQQYIKNKVILKEFWLSF